MYFTGRLTVFILGMFSGWTMIFVLLYLIEHVFRKMYSNRIVCGGCNAIFAGKYLGRLASDPICPKCGKSFVDS